MVEVIDSFIETYNLLIGKFPNFIQVFIELFLWSLLVFFYSWIIWVFYRSVSKKNLLGLNLNKYNKSQHPFFAKLLAGVFYFFEYILVLPFLIFLWFSAFTILLIILSEGLPVSTILLIAIVIIAAIRMTAYYKEDLSKDVAKVLPFALLGVMITNPNFFTNFQSIIQDLLSIPQFFGEIGIYLGFIISLEVILRFFDFIFSLFGFEEEVHVEEENN